MRTITLSLILAVTVLLSNVSLAGSTNNGVPNAGLFAFGPPTSTALASR